MPKKGRQVMKVVKGNLIGKSLKMAIVVSRFNEFISSKLLEGAEDSLIQHGVDENDIIAFWVPGSFEIPPVALKLSNSGKYDAVICLGTVIKGDTPHFDYVSSEVAKGVSYVSLNGKSPCIFGVITADNLEQAIDRAGTKSGNKGRDAAISAIEIANLNKRIK